MGTSNCSSNFDTIMSIPVYKYLDYLGVADILTVFTIHEALLMCVKNYHTHVKTLLRQRSIFARAIKSREPLDKHHINKLAILFTILAIDTMRHTRVRSGTLSFVCRVLSSFILYDPRACIESASRSHYMNRSVAINCTLSGASQNSTHY